MKQRIAYVWLPRLETNRLTRSNAGLRDKPLAIIANSHNAVFLHAINDIAQTAGLTPGMTLASARTICPALVTHPENPKANRQAFTAIAKWCRTFTPLIARDATHGLFLDITGCAHLFGGEHEMLKTISARLKHFQLNAALALADTPGAAWALAHFSTDRTIAPPKDTAQTIAPLPITGLRIDAETADTLNRLGLNRIKDLYPLPNAQLTARFGTGLVRRLCEALGTQPEPLDFDIEPRPYRAITRLIEPINRTTDVEIALQQLLEQLCTHLEKDGLGARRLKLTLTRVDNTTTSLEIGTVAPCRTPKNLERLFRDRIEKLDAGFGFERIALHATTVQKLNPRQAVLTQTKQHVPLSYAALARTNLLNTLANRLGTSNVTTYTPNQSHLPERAYRICQLASHTPAKDRFAVGATPRPLRLYHQPIPIRFATSNHDTANTMILFGAKHAIHPLTGPERICNEWWHNDPAWSCHARDYWWVEDDEGHRFWIFKQHQSPAQDPPTQNQWFLHGYGS